METITTTAAELAQAVDELAAIRAEIAELKNREEIRRLFLIASGHTEIDGKLHRVTISTTYRVKEHIEWFASIVNLTDKRYTDSSASNLQAVSLAMPRTFTSGLKFRF